MFLVIECLVYFLVFTFASADQWSIDVTEQQFTALLNGVKVISHTKLSPCLFVGNGETVFTEHHGNFAVDDYVDRRIPLDVVSVVNHTQAAIFSTTDDTLKITLTFKDGAPLSHIKVSDNPAGFDRVWIRFTAQPADKVYGGGEQFTYFNLRNRTFPIWTREQGVGRNKSSLLTFKADTQAGGAGGDYHTTYYGEPTFFSTAGYMLHSTASVYTILDFRAQFFHELEIHGNIGSLMVSGHTGAAVKDLSAQYVKYSGLLPALPDWVFTGAIIGVQGGTEKMLDYVKAAEDHSVKVNAMWIQDWAGRIKTSFGSRVFWNWEWNAERYPNLDKEIAKLKTKGIRVLTYINPYLNIEGDLYKEANKEGHFVKNLKGETHVADFGEFYCGTIDLTNPAAVEWYKRRIVKRAMDLGISGWMADFSEYLPVEDVVFHSGETAAELHNKWPVLWAKLNREAVEESGKLGDVVFWMRAGYTGTANYTTLQWAGDQMVDYTISDGLASTIPAALSMGLQGVGITHFDIGGYSSLYGEKRDKELLLRSAEAAVFTPVMRTHEGNRPLENWQVYSDDDTWRQFARLTQMFVKMKDYNKKCMDEYVQSGVPMQHPLFFNNPDDEESYAIEHQYMYGDDLLVAPVLEPNVNKRTAYLPPGEWVHLWTEKLYNGGIYVTVDAPLGETPVFYRKDSTFNWNSIIIPRVDGNSNSTSLILPTALLALISANVLLAVCRF